MTTPRDLLIVSLDVPSAHPVGQGDLSLALAGAELVDLLRAGALALDGERVVPGADPAEPEDRLLREAGASLRREVPYESVEDWLWRRGEASRRPTTRDWRRTACWSGSGTPGSGCAPGAPP